MRGKRAQFLIMALVFVSIAFFVIFAYVRTIETSSVISFERNSLLEFENLDNAIENRNAWLSVYWWNLNWNDRSTVSISNGTNPVEIDPGIPLGINCTKEVRVIDSSNTEVSSDVTSSSSPCNVTFTATMPAIYYVYWGNSAATTPAYRGISIGNAASYSIIGQESVPIGQLCPHFESLYPQSGIALNCAAQNIIADKTLNYSISFSSLDMNFEGFLN